MKNKIISLNTVIAALASAWNYEICKEIDGIFLYEPTFNHNMAHEDDERGDDGGFLWITSMDRTRYTFRAQDNEVVEVDDYGHLILVDSRGENRMIALYRRMETTDILSAPELTEA